MALFYFLAIVWPRGGHFLVVVSYTYPTLFDLYTNFSVTIRTASSLSSYGGERTPSVVYLVQFSWFSLC